MKLPKSVKVGYRTFKIELKSKDFMEDMGKVADCDKEGGIIRLGKHHLKASPQIAAEAILHEILHAIYYNWDLDDSDKEEKIVTQLTFGLCSVIVDNPKMWKWIMENIRQ